MVFDKVYSIKSICAVTNYNSSSCFFLRDSLISECGTFICSEVSPETCTTNRREYHISAPSPPCVACGASGKGDLCCLPNTCKEGKCGNGNDGANNMEWNGISLIWL